MKLFFLSMIFVLAGLAAQAQCTVYDGQGNAVNNPVWVSCSGGAYTLYVQSPNNLGYLIIDWGDGSPNTVVNGLVPPAFVSHTYAATINNFNVTITDTTNNCVINGLAVLEEPVNASIQIPIGGVTQTCAPEDLIFNNSSTDVSQNTVFTWDFGDGSPILTFGPANAGQTITHTYQQNTVNCVTQVTLTAENYCSFGNPTTATFNPIQIYDIDDAQITASNVLLCYPDTVVHFDNTTAKNCVPQGNTAQRFEYWNFGNYWGTGNDSIIDWSPFDPPAKPGYDIAFPGIGTYTIMMADSNQCGADTAFITVQVVPPPTAGITADLDSACTGDIVTFTNTSVGGNQTLIDFGDGGGFQAMGATSTYVYGTSGTYTVRLVRNITGGTASCTDTASVDVIVLVSPVAVASLAPAGGCDSVSVSFLNSSSGAVSYYWNFGNGDTSILQNPPPVQYNTPGQSQVILEVTSNNGCTAADTAAVNVYDVPAVNFGFQNVCEDSPASFVDSSTVGFGGPINQWTWSFGDPLNSTSNLQSPTFSYPDSGTYTVTLVASTPYCTDSSSQTFVVEPKPSLAFSMSDSIGCSDLTVVFTNSTTGAATYLWDFGDGNTSTNVSPTHNFVHNSLSDTAFEVTLVAYSSFGCMDTLKDSVTVLGNPVAEFSSDAVLDCAPLVVNFSDSSQGSIAWDWDFGDNTGSNVQHPSKIFQNQTQFITNYNVSLVATAPNGCTDTAIEAITVYPEPLFNFSIVPDSGCSPLTVSFPVAVGAIIYDWDFGDGSGSTVPSPTHTFVNNTTNNQLFNVTLIATSPFGCIDTVQGSVKIFPLPDASFTPLLSEGCQPLNASFTNTSTGGTTYEWDFDNGDTLNTNNVSVSTSYSNSSNDTAFYYPKLRAITPEGCIDSTINEVRVFRKIEASFGVPTPGCHPYYANFTDSSLNAVSWDWDFDNGQIASVQNPQMLFINNGTNALTFDVELEATSLEGCTDDTMIQITVNPKPTSNFSINASPACHGETVSFTNTSLQNTTNLWEYGANNGFNSNNLNNFDTVFSNTGSTTDQFDITLVVENSFGCTDTSLEVMQVHPLVQANFSVPTPACHPYSAQFNNTSINAVNWTWDFDNGQFSNQQNPSVTYINQTTGQLTFDVELTVLSQQGCSSDTIIPVQVFPKPTANFDINNSPACHDQNVTLTNNSVQNTINSWQFGTSTFPVINNSTTIDTSFLNFTSLPKQFPITLEVENSFGCKDTLAKNMQVFPFVEAQFAAIDEGCSEFEVEFNNQSSGAVLYEWNFGDGDVSFENDPTHIFSNTTAFDTTYVVELQATSAYGCISIDSLEIVVHPTPLPQFTATPFTQVFPQSTVTIDNLTPSGPWDYNWSFGDATSDTVESPGSKVFSTWGEYQITLTVSSSFCEDTAMQRIIIEPPVPIADFDTLVIGCEPVSVQFNNNSLYGESFLWEFGDGATSNASDPFYTYQFAGQYTVKLTVTGPGGDTDSKTIMNTITVHEQPLANFAYSPSQVNVPLQPVTFVNYSQDADSYLWDFGDTNTSTDENPQHLYEQEGQFYPQLIAFNDAGCSDTMISEVPVVGILVGEVEIPNAFTPNLTGSTGGTYDPKAFDNQIFFPVLSGVSASDYTLSIFNRWGELIFETHDVNRGWDGYYRGKICQQDAYVWKIKGEYVNGRKFTRVGDVTLIR